MLIVSQFSRFKRAVLLDVLVDESIVGILKLASTASKQIAKVAECFFALLLAMKDDPAEAVARLKQQSGKDLVIFGSGRLVSELAQAGLIDEYQLRVNPVVLGSGKPLFPDLKKVVKLKLLDSSTSPSGVVVLHYHLDNT